MLGLLGDHLAATKPLRQALEAREGRDVIGEALARLDLAANQLELANFGDALAEARDAGLLGENILGSGFDFDNSSTTFAMRRLASNSVANSLC